MIDQKDLTTGSLWKKMFVFSMPLIITNLLQAVYNIVDMVVVGQYVGSAGLSAVSIGGQVTAVILSLVMGLSGGGTVMIAQLAGAKRLDEIKRVVSTMTGVFVALAILLSLVVCVSARPVLHILNTPSEAFSMACSYLRICMIGTIFIYLYNMLSASLRGIGESVLPMILVGISSCLNIALDVWFVGWMCMGSDGAAWATVLSQAFNCVALYLVVRKKEWVPRPGRGMVSIHRQKFAMLMKVGIPQSVEFIITNISFLFLNSMINAYGVYASAAAGAAVKLGNFAVLSGQAVFSAIITMTGQNIGAKQYGRVMKGMGMGIVYALPVAVIFWLLSCLWPVQMLSLFTPEAEVLAVGAPYLQVVSVSFVIESVMLCMMGVMAGAGYSNITLVCTVIDAVAVRIIFARVLSISAGLGFMGIAYAYPCAPAVSLILCIIFIASGRWKNSRISI